MWPRITCVTSFLSANFQLPVPFRSRLGSDSGQTDGQTDKTSAVNASCPTYGAGHHKLGVKQIAASRIGFRSTWWIAACVHLTFPAARKCDQLTVVSWSCHDHRRSKSGRRAFSVSGPIVWNPITNSRPSHRRRRTHYWIFFGTQAEQQQFLTMLTCSQR